jgi:hypothetical protein
MSAVITSLRTRCGASLHNAGAVQDWKISARRIRHAQAAPNLINVSKLWSHLSHAQNCRISSPLRRSENSEHSGAIINSPHLGQEGRPK